MVCVGMGAASKQAVVVVVVIVIVVTAGGRSPGDALSLGSAFFTNPSPCSSLSLYLSRWTQNLDLDLGGPGLVC